MVVGHVGDADELVGLVESFVDLRVFNHIFFYMVNRNVRKFLLLIELKTGEHVRLSCGAIPHRQLASVHPLFLQLRRVRNSNLRALSLLRLRHSFLQSQSRNLNVLISLLLRFLVHVDKVHILPQGHVLAHLTLSLFNHLLLVLLRRSLQG